MLPGNIRMAVDSVKSSKLHSFLTMFGIIVGVASVVTMVSLGEGFKQQIRGQVAQSGADIITIRPGRLVNRDTNGEVTGLNIFSTIGGNAISEKELGIIRATPNVKEAVPFSIVTGIPSYENTDYTSGTILATTDLAPQILNQEIDVGNFYDAGENDKNVVVIGRRIADELYKEQAPIGKHIMIRGQRFLVVGIFKEFPSISINAGTDFNRSVFVPYDAAKRINGGSLPIFEVLVRPTSPDQVNSVVDNIRNQLRADHQGQEDFTVLKSEENLMIADNLLDLATILIASIAGISLLVGGIGIMNIMFALVTERTGEVGIRKAIGASNQQILGQFLVEAIVLSTIGGFIGIALSLAANVAFRILTDLEPVINIPIIGIATGVSIAVGIISGVIPALRAARKDPIEALRSV